MATATAKKAAPKAAPVEQAEDATLLPEGSIVLFKGYEEGTPEEDMLLDTETEYELVGYEDDAQEGMLPILKAPNPDFDDSKKANAKSNPQFIEVVVFPEEIELVAAEEAEEEAAEEEAPAKGKKTAAKPAAKEAAKPAAKGKAKAEEAPAKGKGKAKAEEKAPAPAKGKGKGKEVAKNEEPEEDHSLYDVPDLEFEDQSVLDLVAETDDLIGLVQDKEAEIALTEFQIGGILYHVKRDTDWQSKDEAFAGPGGWKLFIESYYNLGFRKATQLIAIYVAFNQSGLENPAEIVSNLGWSKAAKLCAYINEEGVDQEALLETANETAASDLSTVLKTTFTEGGSSTKTPGETKSRTTLRFSFDQEEGEVAQEILAEAVQQLGAATSERALLAILMDWRAQNVAGAADAQEEEEEAEEAKPTKGRAAAKPASKPAAKPASKSAAKGARK